MLEMLDMLKKNAPSFASVTPIVITLLFAEDRVEEKPVRFGNEITEVLEVVLNTRSGRSKTSRELLKRFVMLNNGGFILDEPLLENENKVPMNWVLSQQSMGYIAADVRRRLADTSSSGLMARILRKDLIFLSNSKP